MKHPFDRCVIITNTGSTNYRRARRLAKEVKKYFADDQVDVIEVTPGQASSVDKLVKETVGALNGKTLVCVGGGDGSISLFINKLLLTPGLSKAARQAVILPLWGGNANDLAYMANGTAYAVNIRRILSKGRIVKVYPLEVKVTGGKPFRQLASNYVSFGMSAYAARQVNKLNGRNSVYRAFVELLTILKAARRIKPFTAEIDGRQATLYDLILINGSRIAKVYRAPNRLTDRAFFELVIDRKHPFFLPYLARVIRGLTWRRNRRSSHTLTVHDNTWAQLDGEVVEIPKGSRIDIKTCTTPFYVLSTKLRS
jgi:diacylglycerol kinase family enzyme